jgi:hypothetical protein
MRLIFAAAISVFAVNLLAPAPGFAQQQQPPQPQQQTVGSGQALTPLHRTFNSCVELAMQRGWNYSDLTDDKPEVRNFVVQCMQGQQR